VLLRDVEIQELLRASPPLVTPSPSNVEELTDRSSVQAASLDLRIGKIFLPQRGREQEGGYASPGSFFALKSGQTALIETLEELQMPPDLAAIGFPPARVSSEGLLMTNPGHIDGVRTDE
jgi:deoxycytidine triphosphate deaminase